MFRVARQFWRRQPQTLTPVDTTFAKPLVLLTPQGPVPGALSTSVNPTRVGTVHGVGHYYAGTTYYQASAGFLTDSAGAGSVAGVNKSLSFTFVITSNAAVEGLACCASSATSATSAFIFQNNAGTLRVYNNSAWTDLGPAVIGKLHTVSITYEDFSPYPLKFYLDGVYIGQTTGYKNDWDAYPFFIGSGFGGGSINALILQSLVIQGAHTNLTNEWHAMYGRNPWRLYAPMLRRVYVPQAAAATPVLSAATVANITATTVTPRVTITI